MLDQPGIIQQEVDMIPFLEIDSLNPHISQVPGPKNREMMIAALRRQNPQCRARSSSSPWRVTPELHTYTGAHRAAKI